MGTDRQPEFDGECAFAVSLGKKGVPGSDRHRLEVDGNVYHFKNGVARMLWRLLPNRAAKARAVWAG